MTTPFELELAFTETYQRYLRADPALREAHCLWVLLPPLFERPQPGDLFVGRMHYPAVGFGLELTSGGPVYYCYAERITPHLAELPPKERARVQVMAEARKDFRFYQKSGGGLTITGGEPMLQLEFTLDLLKAAKAEGIHTCLETCGWASERAYRSVLPFVDLFLFDYKATDPQTHRRRLCRVCGQCQARTQRLEKIRLIGNRRDEHFSYTDPCTARKGR